MGYLNPLLSLGVFETVRERENPHIGRKNVLGHAMSLSKPSLVYAGSGFPTAQDAHAE